MRGVVELFTSKSIALAFRGTDVKFVLTSYQDASRTLKYP
jgi:hypothetical protein